MRLYADGSRKATLRRKVIRAVRTQLGGPSQAGYPGGPLFPPRSPAAGRLLTGGRPLTCR